MDDRCWYDLDELRLRCGVVPVDHPELDPRHRVHRRDPSTELRRGERRIGRSVRHDDGHRATSAVGDHLHNLVDQHDHDDYDNNVDDDHYRRPIVHHDLDLDRHAFDVDDHRCPFDRNDVAWASSADGRHDVHHVDDAPNSEHDVHDDDPASIDDHGRAEHDALDHDEFIVTYAPRKP